MLEADTAHYVVSLEKIAEMPETSPERVFMIPVEPILFDCLHRWMQLDVLDRNDEMSAGYLALLRAETLVAYAKVEKSPLAKEWASYYLDSIPASASRELRDRIARLRARLPS